MEGGGEAGRELRLSLSSFVSLPYVHIIDFTSPSQSSSQRQVSMTVKSSTTTQVVDTSNSSALANVDTLPTPQSLSLSSPLIRLEPETQQQTSMDVENPVPLPLTFTSCYKLILKMRPDYDLLVLQALATGLVDLTARNTAGKQLVHLAAWRGSCVVLEAVLAAGGDINGISTGPGNYGYTLLHYITPNCTY